MAKRRTKQASALIIEPHPPTYTGFPFITLVKFKNDHVLCIIDNVTDKDIKCYVLDMCGPELVSEELVVALADKWFSESKDKYPFSVEVSKQGYGAEFSRVYKQYDIEHITRVIGPIAKFDMGDDITVRRRKRKPVPPELMANNKVIKIR